jgi:uncharacterized protein (DUF58 family)
MVRDHEQEERDVVWILLDASVELWAGAPGHAPLDHAIDEAMAVAEAHLARGDHVGLAICGARVLSRLPPERGPAQAAKIAQALVFATLTIDCDRSGLGADDVASRVLEHLKPLDPGAASGLSRDRIELAQRAALVVGRAPFLPLPVYGVDVADKALRGYLSAFGIPSPSRLEPDRPRTDDTLAALFAELPRLRPHPSLMYVWSPMPDPEKRGILTDALRKHARRRVELRWVRLELEEAIERGSGSVAHAVHSAVALRARVGEAVGEHALRRLGVTVEKIRPRSLARVSITPPPAGLSDDT